MDPGRPTTDRRRTQRLALAGAVRVDERPAIRLAILESSPIRRS